jgi:hypothetical protein
MAIVPPNETTSTVDILIRLGSARGGYGRDLGKAVRDSGCGAALPSGKGESKSP